MRGAIAKQAIFDKILETFEGSFIYNGGKELRIPFDEEGTLVQIKVTLTCAKENVNIGEEVQKVAAAASQEASTSNFPDPSKPVEPSPQEKQNVMSLLESLGLN